MRGGVWFVGEFWQVVSKAERDAGRDGGLGMWCVGGAWRVLSKTIGGRDGDGGKWHEGCVCVRQKETLTGTKHIRSDARTGVCGMCRVHGE